MDFFELQAQAKRNTAWLVLLFVLAVGFITVAIYGAVRLVLERSSWGTAQASFFEPALFAQVAVATLAVVGLGSLYKTIAVRGGGAVVARDLGAVAVDPATNDLHERQLLNVVEEMAIAAGI